MKIPVSIAENLVNLQNGEKVPFSKMKHETIATMIENGILKKQTIGRSKAIIYLPDKAKLDAYIQNHFGIESLKSYVEGLNNAGLTRAEAVAIASNSKLKSIRTFKGFLVNSFQSVECKIGDRHITIHPQEGTFVFIYDFENFIPTDNATIVGIENPYNFRYIYKQRNLFENINPLFVSRYPQSKDLVKWLHAIPNNYLHFGDFDFAGLNIYINEFKKHLQGKANFFLPNDIEDKISAKGNRENYNKQSIQFDRNDVKEENILTLLKLIEKYKKGLEQEIYAK